MLAIERRNAILSKLYLDGKVIVSALSQEFDVTEETIRRDLDKLDKEGLVKKSYGGAVLVQNFSTDLPHSVRKKANVEAKQKIAEKISTLFQDGDCIMLDASSTALLLLNYIRNLKNITLITNSVEALIELSDKDDWNVFSTGGKLKKGSLSLVGPSAEKTIRSFHVDYAVCSSKGLDSTRGITDSNEKDSEMKQAIFESAETKILCVDSSKFDKISLIKVGNVNEVDIIATDTEPSANWQEYLKRKNVELIY
ncbi:MAG: DeoR/GlpR transcriptional regulator [Clostridia bacterium]|nr:DeoR/GlpR transcriptional regulator [Clostridia bacterium]